MTFHDAYHSKECIDGFETRLYMNIPHANRSDTVSFFAVGVLNDDVPGHRYVFTDGQIRTEKFDFSSFGKCFFCPNRTVRDTLDRFGANDAEKFYPSEELEYEAYLCEDCIKGVENAINKHLNSLNESSIVSKNI